MQFEMWNNKYKKLNFGHYLNKIYKLNNCEE